MMTHPSDPRECNPAAAKLLSDLCWVEALFCRVYAESPLRPEGLIHFADEFLRCIRAQTQA